MAALLLAATGAAAQPRFESERSRDRFEEDGRYCAREQSFRYAPTGAGALGGAARGAMHGLVSGKTGQTMLRAQELAEASDRIVDY
jgi:hypothetical protein